MSSLDTLFNDTTRLKGASSLIVATFVLIYIFAIFVYFSNDVCDVKNENEKENYTSCMAKKTQITNIVFLGSIILIIFLIIYIYKPDIFKPKVKTAGIKK
jgi:heme/copper-type cytochrome/quinol oxidase subunit 2